jgi:TolA-binding protein
MLNPNIEYRNLKQCSNYQNPNYQNERGNFGHLKIGILDLFRISDFGFRILISNLLVIIWCLAFGAYSNSYAQDFSEAQQYYLQGNYQEAIETLEKTLATNPDSPSAEKVYYLLALSYLQRKNYLRAGDCFDIIIKEYLQSPLAQAACVKLIDIDLIRDNFNKALESCDAFLATYPQSDRMSAVLLRQYRAQLGLKNSSDAQELLVKLKTSYADSPELKVAPGMPSQQAAAGFSVQVGSFKDKTNAQNLSDILKKKGFDSFVEEYQVSGDYFFRVRVGKLSSKQEAEQLEQRLKQEGYSTKIYP